MFGCAVHAPALIGLMTCYGSDHHDIPTPSVEHLRQNSPCNVEDSQDIRLDHLAPGPAVSIRDLFGAPGESGVVDQDVNWPLSRIGCCQEGLNGRLIGYVEFLSEAFGAEVWETLRSASSK